ncbi:MAG: hypothetical protein V3V14_13470 [Saprospiraceae bacterium]
MRKSIFTIVLMIVAFSVYSQTDSLDNWLVNMSLGIEAHDKRLFNYSEKESLLEMQPEFWGTYHSEFNLNRKFLQNSRLSSFIGLGLSYENATFLRPFDHSYFKKDSFRILRNLNKYKKVDLPISLSVFYEFAKNLQVSGTMSSNILLFKSIDHTENNSDVFPYSESTFEIDNFNLNLGLLYQLDKWLIGINARLINFEKIDKIIFNDIIKDPRIDQNWEWNNTLQFNFIIGYMW